MSAALPPISSYRRARAQRLVAQLRAALPGLLLLAVFAWAWTVLGQGGIEQLVALYSRGDAATRGRLIGMAVAAGIGYRLLRATFERAHNVPLPPPAPVCEHCMRIERGEQ